MSVFLRPIRVFARTAITAVVVSCLSVGAGAAGGNPGGYAGNEAAQALVDELVVEEGFNREELLTVFASARRQESILTAIARPAEKTKPWYEYRKIFLNDKRLEQGVENKIGANIPLICKVTINSITQKETN